jgi:enolase-phosphatase E1
MSNLIEFGDISHILLDIEGTTCPVNYVSQTLFPYASQQLPTYLHVHQGDPDIAALIEELEKLWQEDKDPAAKQLRRQQDSPATEPAQALMPYLQHLIRTDQKVTALKDLQGRIWESGYSQGVLVAPIYEDVPSTLSGWKEQGLCLAVYSSGSIAAQKLLYRYSNAGNLSTLFEHWFDTRTGLKQTPESYSSISRHMQCESTNILFISDSYNEVEAAHQAGLHVLLSHREDSPIPPSPYQAIRSFHEIILHPIKPNT